MKVEGKAIVTNRTKKMGEDEKRIEFWDIDTVLGWSGVGATMSTEIWRSSLIFLLVFQ